MATSGTTSFTINRGDFIRQTLIYIGQIGQGQSVSANENAFCSIELNKILKYLQTKGLNLWCKQDITVFSVANQATYQIMGTSGDYAASSYVSTTTSASAALGASAITVTSATGLAANQYIGILLSDNTRQWTTISSVASTTINLGATLTKAVAAGATVYAYSTTNAVSAPKEVLDLNYQYASGLELPMVLQPEQGYFRQPLKNIAALPTQYATFRLIDRVNFSVFPAPQDATGVFRAKISRTLQDVNYDTDNFDLPVEWLYPLTLFFAMHLCIPYGKDSKMIHIQGMATDAFQNVKNWDQEHSYFQIVPKLSPR